MWKAKEILLSALESHMREDPSITYHAILKRKIESYGHTRPVYELKQRKEDAETQGLVEEKVQIRSLKPSLERSDLLTEIW